MEKIEVILPCYNEGGNVEAIVDAIMDLDLTAYEINKVMVVDDGSTDSTAEYCKKLSSKYGKLFSYLKHTKNLGKEHAIYTGLRYATNDFILVMDADFQDSVDTIEELALTIYLHKDLDAVAVVSSNPFSPIHSLFYPLFTKLTGIHLPANVRDMRIIRKHVVDEILDNYGYFFKAELERRGYKVGYIPRLIGCRRAGSSTFSFVKYCIYAFKVTTPFVKPGTMIALLNYTVQVCLLLAVVFGTPLAPNTFIFINTIINERRLIDEITITQKICSVREQYKEILRSCGKRRKNVKS